MQYIIFPDLGPDAVGFGTINADAEDSQGFYIYAQPGLTHAHMTLWLPHPGGCSAHPFTPYPQA